MIKEYTIGKGGVGSSILLGGTIFKTFSKEILSNNANVVRYNEKHETK